MLPTQHQLLGSLTLTLIVLVQCIVQAQQLQRAAAAAATTAAASHALHELHELRIGGCQILARGRLLAKDRLMMSLDPIMCASGESLRLSAASRYDPIAKHFYVTIPVTLWNDTVRQSAILKLRNRKYNWRVEFASVSDISVSTDSGSVFAALGFLWSQGEPVGYLRLGCDTLNRDSVNRSDAKCEIGVLVSNLRSGNFAALSRVRLSATLWNNPIEGPVVLDYRLTVTHDGRGDSTKSDEALADYSLNSRIGPGHLVNCASQPLQPMLVTSVRLRGNCTAAVYSFGRGSDEGRYLVETPICYANSASAGDEADYSTGRHRVILGFVDFSTGGTPAMLAEVKEQLEAAKFKVKHPVTFMTLWGASHKVSGLLAGRYEVGMLRAATQEGEVDELEGGISGGLLTVHCYHAMSCRYLLSKIAANPVNFWRHIAWHPVYKLPLNLDDPSSGHCVHSPVSARFSVAMTEPDSLASGSPGALEAGAWKEACSAGSPCANARLSDGRQFVVIQQREAGNVSFDRPWSDYESGFGDRNDFWIGLKAIHLLSTHGVTMRVEMKLWNDTDLFAEYAGFTVGDASTSYRMTYREIITGRSNVAFDAMDTSKGLGFSTYDRDNDRDPGSCSLTWGRGGWWFNACYKFFPNGLFPTTITNDWKYIIWVEATQILSLRHVRIMLQI